MTTNATYTSPEWTHFKYPMSISPLPNSFRFGLKALVALSLVSCVSTLSLISFLLYRFVVTRKHCRAPLYKNQHMILILSLVIADFQCDVGFFLDIVWLVKGEVVAPSAACITQAWLVNIGDLGSGFFVFAIAAHTFANVVLGVRFRLRSILFGSAVLWILAHVLTIIPVILHPENIFVLQGNWCSINGKHEMLRLYFHYIWVFIAEGLVLIMYGITFIFLRKRLGGIRPTQNRTSITTGENSNTTTEQISGTPKKITRATMYMILYPTVYVLTTLPLAAGRISNLAGKPVPRRYLLAGGILMSCGGWLNCLLYSLTRSVFLLSGSPDETPHRQRRSLYAAGTVNDAAEMNKEGSKTGNYREIPSPLGSTDNIVNLGKGEQPSLEFNGKGVIMETTWEIQTENIGWNSSSTARSGSMRFGHHTYVSN